MSIYKVSILRLNGKERKFSVKVEKNARKVLFLRPPLNFDSEIFKPFRKEV